MRAKLTALIADKRGARTRSAPLKKPLTPMPVKARRRSPAEIGALLDATLGIIADTGEAISLRHLFYRLVGRGVIPKTEAAYSALGDHLTKWRRAGAVPWDAFSDSTRWHIKSRTFDSMGEALTNTADTYRRDLWQSQALYVECWVEKDAIASFVSGVADSYGVPTFVCRGCASLTSLSNAAATFKNALAAGKEPVIFYLGDHDPTGLCIDRAAHKSLRDDFGVEVEFRRIAVLPEQIVSHGLLTRPVKLSDSRAKGWEGGCVEVDALEPRAIKELVETAVSSCINEREWNALRRTETLERETIRGMLGLAGEDF